MKIPSVQFVCYLSLMVSNIIKRLSRTLNNLSSRWFDKNILLLDKDKSRQLVYIWRWQHKNIYVYQQLNTVLRDHKKDC